MKNFKKYLDEQSPSPELLNRTKEGMKKAQRQMELEEAHGLQEQKEESAFHWQRYAGLAAALALVIGLGCFALSGQSSVSFRSLSEEIMRPLTQTQAMENVGIAACSAALGVDVSTLPGGYEAVSAAYVDNEDGDSYYLLAYQGEDCNLRLLVSQEQNPAPEELLAQVPDKIMGQDVWFGATKNNQSCAAWSQDKLYCFLIAYDLEQKKFVHIVRVIMKGLA